ncbi:type II secretion system F family protein [Anaerobaca lacustris]|uniref:Type II secretion system F family protein n=1 Tax=Anaerobaca lacustris TaxID=3044600 RepID=A0AAW6TVN3_9BACT|nr:type II secretion system F family protein [Sedimentisphaerales bacterium M17dextr]
MSQFSYKAVDRAGAHVAGSVEASDRRSAVAVLAQRGHFVTDLMQQAHRGQQAGEETSLAQSWPALASLGGGRVAGKDILAMTTQLSTAVRAGLPLLNCLELLRKQQRKSATKRLFDHLVQAVNSGQSLSEAMAEHPNVFGPLYLSMIRVGETGGILEQTSAQLASILSREEKIKTNMKNASAYPIFVMAMGLISAVVIVTWILPGILSTVDAGAAAMPLPTRVLMGISDFLRALGTSVGGWIVLGALAVGIYGARRWVKTAGRLEWDAFKLRIPVLGSVLRTIAVGRFARTLGALTQGGVTILEALAVVRDTLGNEMLARRIDEVAEKVKRGESLATPLEESECFPPLLVQVVAIGEQTGKLDELLLNAADTFDTDADAAISRFMAVFPAALILILALLIGFIIAAALLPIMMMSLGAGAL